MEPDPVYYRLYVNNKDEPCIVCMQWFDEPHYDQARFINDERYYEEKQAEEALLALKVRTGIELSVLEKLKVAAMSGRESSE